MRYPTLRLSALVVALAAVASAVAALPPQTFYQQDHAAGSCQPAREYPDLRVRQLEMDNIGTGNAYVVCAINPRLANQGVSSVAMVNVIFFNAGSVPATIRCTLKDQWGVLGPLTSHRKEVELSPGEVDGVLFRAETDGIFQTDLLAAGVQCILPPNTSVLHTGTEFTYTFEAAE